MSGFSRNHPIVNFIFFAFVLIISMFSEHPAMHLTGFILSAACAIVLMDGKKFARQLRFVVPLMLLTALLNPLLSHEGKTTLFLLPGGNPCTLEALLYGAFAGIRMGTVLFWFICWNAVITSDKFLFLFGRIFPSLSLTISMGLRFVPRFLRRFKEVSDAQKCLNPQKKGIRHAGKVLSAVVSWALENALDTADSMKSRGYGLKNRSAFSVYRFTPPDAAVLASIVLLGGSVIAGWACGALAWQFYPFMQGGGNIFTIISTILYGVLCAIPLLLEGKEVLQWHLSKSKI